MTLRQSLAYVLRHAWLWPLEFWLRPLDVIDRAKRPGAAWLERACALLGGAAWGALAGAPLWVGTGDASAIWALAGAGALAAILNGVLTVVDAVAGAVVGAVVIAGAITIASAVGIALAVSLFPGLHDAQVYTWDIATTSALVVVTVPGLFGDHKNGLWRAAQQGDLFPVRHYQIYWLRVFWAVFLPLVLITPHSWHWFLPWSRPSPSGCPCGRWWRPWPSGNSGISA